MSERMIYTRVTDTSGRSRPIGVAFAGLIGIGAVLLVLTLVAVHKPSFAQDSGVANYYQQHDTIRNADLDSPLLHLLSVSETITYYVHLPLICRPPVSVTVAFFYDRNLNGSQDATEPMLTNLQVSSDPPYPVSPSATVRVPVNTAIVLHIEGLAPNSKPLSNATFREPYEIVPLPEFPYTVYSSDVLIGLADGYCTSPVSTTQLNWGYYNYAYANPTWWAQSVAPWYPTGWPYAPNYLFWGARIREGYFTGRPHLAFDPLVPDGTTVRAPAPGTIVQGDFDHIIAVQWSGGKIDLNHLDLDPTLLNPDGSIRYGTTVARYQTLGTIGINQGHIHMETRPREGSSQLEHPDTGNILTCWPGFTQSQLLTSPLSGQPFEAPPYFGP